MEAQNENRLALCICGACGRLWLGSLPYEGQLATMLDLRLFWGPDYPTP